MKSLLLVSILLLPLATDAAPVGAPGGAWGPVVDVGSGGFSNPATENLDMNTFSLVSVGELQLNDSAQLQLGTDGDTYILGTSADIMQFYANGGERFRITETELLSSEPLSIRAALGATTQFQRDDVTPSAGNTLGQLKFNGYNSAASSINISYGFLIGRIDDPTAGSEDGELALSVLEGGAQTEYLKIDGGGGLLSTTKKLEINEGANGVELQIPSADTLAIRDKAGTGPADLSLATAGRLELNDAGTSWISVTSGTQIDLFSNSENTLSVSAGNVTMSDRFIIEDPAGAQLRWRRDDTSMNDGDTIVDLLAEADSDGATTNHDYASIHIVAEDVSDGTEDGSIEIHASSAGVSDALQIKFNGLTMRSEFSVPHEYIGEMYQRDNSTATTINTIDVWEEIDNYVSGDLSGWTHATGDLTVTNANSYVCHYTASFETTGNNQLTELALSVNNTIQDKCIVSRLIGTGTDEGNAGGHCSLTLAASDVVKLETRNRSSTNDVTVIHSNVLCEQR